MSKSNRESQYGTFGTKKTWYLRYKSLTVAGGTAAVLFVVIIFAYQLFKHDEQKALLNIPEVAASDMPGWWYKEYFGSSICLTQNCTADADPDKDKLTNQQEFYYRSNPMRRDSNENGLTDGEDVANNFDPSRPGKVTFEQASSDENILGESLVFNEDVKTIINETLDPNKIVIPQSKDEELRIIDDSVEAIDQYTKKNIEIVQKYFPQQILANIQVALESGNVEIVEDLKMRSLRALVEMKKVETPKSAVQLHKYTIAFMELVPLIATVPPPNLLGDEYSPEANLWFDNVQAFSLLQQKIDIEVYRLKQKFQ